MLLEQIIQLKPELLSDDIKVKETWKNVFKQAQRTSRREGIAEVLKVRRPGESPSILKHRIANTPQHAKSIYDNALSKISRIIRNSSLKVEGFSENLKAHLEEKPFNYLSTKVSFEEWFWRCVFPYSMEDPNGLLIAFPRSINNYFVAPSALVEEGGNPANEPVKIEHIVVPYDQIYTLNKWILRIYGGEEMFNQGNKQVKRKFWFVADKQFWYKFYPVWRNNEWQNDYYEWYEHGTGIVPINVLPGKFSTDLQGNKYQESFFRPFYEFADDHGATYSDNIANRVLAFYPKVIMGQIPCPECQGLGQVEGKNSKGDITNYSTCGKCDGNRYVKDLGPYDLLEIPNADLEGMDTSKFLSYIQPPIEATREGYNMSFDLLDRGGKAMGIDVLIDSAESGEAMRRRMEKTTDFLTDVAETCSHTIKRHLVFTDALLNKNPDDRKEPSVFVPHSFEIKDEQILIEDAKNALDADAVNKHLQYYSLVYKDDPVLLGVYKIAYEYCPELAMSKDELDRCERRGQFKDFDVAKRKYVVWAIREIAIDPNFLELKSKDVIEAADKLIRERADIKGAESLVDAGGNLIQQV